MVEEKQEKAKIEKKKDAVAESVEKAEQKQDTKRKEKKTDLGMKIFGLYDISEIKVEDEGLKGYINLEPKLILKSHGRSATEKFGKTKVNIVERFINLIGVPGHRGKKHRIVKGDSSGKYTKNTEIFLEALKIIEKRTKQNPVQVVVRAVENAAPKDEITVIEYGGARYPQAVDVSPTRRLGVALRNLVHGASDKAFNKKKSIAQGLADEIILASEGTTDSFAVQKANESQKQADSAR